MAVAVMVIMVVVVIVKLQVLWQRRAVGGVVRRHSGRHQDEVAL